MTNPECPTQSLLALVSTPYSLCFPFLRSLPFAGRDAPGRGQLFSQADDRQDLPQYATNYLGRAAQCFGSFDGGCLAVAIESCFARPLTNSKVVCSAPAPRNPRKVCLTSATAAYPRLLGLDDAKHLNSRLYVLGLLPHPIVTQSL